MRRLFKLVYHLFCLGVDMDTFHIFGHRFHFFICLEPMKLVTTGFAEFRILHQDSGIIIDPFILILSL